MRIEKLNDNKIRIFLNTEDLKEKNIDIHDLMSSSIESQDLFIDMLNMAETQVGFKTRNYKLIIEALASSDGNFVFTITRVKPEVSNKPATKPKLKRQSFTPNKLLSIYQFQTFDEFCEFCNYLTSSPFDKYIDKLKSSSLVLYKDSYYLILHNLKFNFKDLRSFSYVVSEFATHLKNEDLLENKLKEYGKVIINKNAINTCLKFFR